MNPNSTFGKLLPPYQEYTTAPVPLGPMAPRVLYSGKGNITDLENVMPMTLKEQRNLKHMPVRKLAELSDVSESTIRRIERGTFKTLKPLTIQNLSNALNVAPQEIEQFAPLSRAPR
jgi:DNA-binding Xre family transcriptional regulator